ncbi:hypothetical protein ACXYN8_06670 [Altererythrobacter sp. CAU 1778]
MTDDAKREELERRIEEGQARQEERTLADKASEAAEQATEFVKAHPMATIGGAIAVGLLIGAMTRPGRRLGAKGVSLASAAADLAMVYGLKALDAAEDAARYSGDRIEDIGDTLGDKARKARRELGYQLGGARDAAGITAREGSKKAGRTTRSIRDRIGV